MFLDVTWFALRTLGFFMTTWWWLKETKEKPRLELGRGVCFFRDSRMRSHRVGKPLQSQHTLNLTLSCFKHFRNIHYDYSQPQFQSYVDKGSVTIAIYYIFIVMTSREDNSKQKKIQTRTVATLIISLYHVALWSLSLFWNPIICNPKPIENWAFKR